VDGHPEEAAGLRAEVVSLVVAEALAVVEAVEGGEVLKEIIDLEF
jgi:hypothetical protein